jgi:hypothetical protein
VDYYHQAREKRGRKTRAKNAGEKRGRKKARMKRAGLSGND